MRDALRKLKPDCFDDIIAMVSLYRPGPMDNIPRYTNVKHGVEDPSYLHPLLEPILKETNGVIIYQEQVMEIAKQLAGYTLGGADLLRRAMGKKIKAEMDAQREVFVTGARAAGIEPRPREHDLRRGGEVRLLRLQQEPCRRLCAARLPDRLSEGQPSGRVLRRGDDDRDAPTRRSSRATATRCVQRGIPLFGPDVNASGARFAVETGAGGEGVRYALAAIKGVGAAAMELLVAERAARRPVHATSSTLPAAAAPRC